MADPTSLTLSTMTLKNSTDQFLTLNSIDANDGDLYYQEAAVAIPMTQTATILDQVHGSAKLVFNLTQQMLVEIDLKAFDGANGAEGSATCIPIVSGGTEYAVVGESSPKPTVTQLGDNWTYSYTFAFTVQPA